MPGPANGANTKELPRLHPVIQRLLPALTRDCNGHDNRKYNWKVVGTVVRNRAFPSEECWADTIMAVPIQGAASRVNHKPVTVVFQARRPICVPDLIWPGGGIAPSEVVEKAVKRVIDSWDVTDEGCLRRLLDATLGQPDDPPKPIVQVAQEANATREAPYQDRTCTPAAESVKVTTASPADQMRTQTSASPMDKAAAQLASMQKHKLTAQTAKSSNVVAKENICLVPGSKSEAQAEASSPPTQRSSSPPSCRDPDPQFSSLGRRELPQHVQEGQKVPASPKVSSVVDRHESRGQIQEVRDVQTPQTPSFASGQPEASPQIPKVQAVQAPQSQGQAPLPARASNRVMWILECVGRQRLKGKTQAQSISGAPTTVSNAGLFSDMAYCGAPSKSSRSLTAPQHEKSAQEPSTERATGAVANISPLLPGIDMSDGRERGKVVVESQRVVDQTNRLSSARVSSPQVKRKRTHIEPENFGLAGSPIDVDDSDSGQLSEGEKLQMVLDTDVLGPDLLDGL